MGRAGHTPTRTRRADVPPPRHTETGGRLAASRTGTPGPPGGGRPPARLPSLRPDRWDPERKPVRSASALRCAHSDHLVAMRCPAAGALLRAKPLTINKQVGSTKRVTRDAAPRGCCPSWAADLHASPPGPARGRQASGGACGDPGLFLPQPRAAGETKARSLRLASRRQLTGATRRQVCAGLRVTPRFVTAALTAA